MSVLKILLLSFILLSLQSPAQEEEGWLEDILPERTVGIITPPENAERVRVDEDTFARWLRDFPLKPEDSPVRYYNGKLKPNQSIHEAVLDIDAGDKDLQQCADAVMRLYAEYLYERMRYEKIHFNFTSGDRADYTQWREGWRPKINGNSVKWVKSRKRDHSYKAFGEYLKTVFMYAGTYSLQQEMKRTSTESLKPGDVFLQGGFPGHTVLIVDMAFDSATGKKYFLLAQSYMPAQDIHILKNLNDPEISPWYEVGKFGKLYTPEWTFDWNDSYRFPDEQPETGEQL